MAKRKNAIFSENSNTETTTTVASDTNNNVANNITTESEIEKNEISNSEYSVFNNSVTDTINNYILEIEELKKKNEELQNLNDKLLIKINSLAYQLSQFENKILDNQVICIENKKENRQKNNFVDCLNTNRFVSYYNYKNNGYNSWN